MNPDGLLIVRILKIVIDLLRRMGVAEANIAKAMSQGQGLGGSPMGAGLAGLYAQLPSGQTIPAGTSNGMLMGSNGNVVLCTSSGGALTAGTQTISVNNIAGLISGPAALILLPMSDGSYAVIVAPCPS